MQSPSSITTVFLDQPPSCLQFCPSNPNYFVVGTYLLSEIKALEGDEICQMKTGSLQLWHMDPISNELTQKRKIPLPYAIFDLQFHPKDGTILAIATSNGLVVHFRLSCKDPNVEGFQLDNNADPFMYQLNSYAIRDDASIPALYLAWTPDGFQRSGVDGQAVTFSDGSTSIFSFSQLGMCGSRSFTSHEGSEVWFVAVSIYRSTHSSKGQWQEDTSSWTEQDVPFLFTGNDFGTFRTQIFASDNELDSDNDSHDNLRPVTFEYEDKARHHTAGITSILPLPINLVDDSPIVLTGSYDEYLRVYHATLRGNVLAKRRLGGGVWRLLLLEDNSERTTTSDGEECLTKSFIILASCMHAGVRVLRVTYRQGLPGSIALNDLGAWGIDVLAQFTEHESMNYASDVWKYSGDGARRSSLLCISSSFYDRRVCVWEVNKRTVPGELCYDV